LEDAKTAKPAGVTSLGIPAAADHPVSSLQKMMGKIRPVLTGNAGDQSSFIHRRSFFSIIGVVGPLASWLLQPALMVRQRVFSYFTIHR
jgi:hypothetical protein